MATTRSRATTPKAAASATVRCGFPALAWSPGGDPLVFIDAAAPFGAIALPFAGAGPGAATATALPQDGQKCAPSRSAAWQVGQVVVGVTWGHLGDGSVWPGSGGPGETTPEPIGQALPARSWYRRVDRPIATVSPERRRRGPLGVPLMLRVAPGSGRTVVAPF